MSDNKNPFEMIYIKDYKKFIDLFENNQEYQLVLHTFVLPSNLSQLSINCNTVGETV